MKKLHVKAVGDKLCPHYEAFDQGQMRFVGRKRDPQKGTKGGWVPTEEVVELPYRLEYLQELKAGALAPADALTARLAGVPFEKNGVTNG